jgi:transposase
VIEILCGGKAYRHRGVTRYGAAPPHIGARHIRTDMCRDTYPFCGAVYVFRSKRMDRVKLLWWDGTGICLMTKRLESAQFRWPPIEDGMMKLSAVQLAALLEGGQWARVERREVIRPSATQ